MIKELRKKQLFPALRLAKECGLSMVALGASAPYACNSGKQNGTGLGLSYCNRSMTALGGNIDCKSELGNYTAFTLTFPELPKQKKSLGRATTILLIFSQFPTIRETLWLIFFKKCLFVI
ncbi:MAG: ATP-binding protein [Porticoccaceae bacterium]|nr:ATP-binding protein [Porticoccaceae bacterium]